jgi:hypothetical protein
MHVGITFVINGAFISVVVLLNGTLNHLLVSKIGCEKIVVEVHKPITLYTLFLTLSRNYNKSHCTT